MLPALLLLLLGLLATTGTNPNTAVASQTTVAASSITTTAASPTTTARPTTTIPINATSPTTAASPTTAPHPSFKPLDCSLYPKKCQNLKTAIRCRAVSECSVTYWNQSTVDTTPCDMCLNVVKLANKQRMQLSSDRAVLWFVWLSCEWFANSPLITRCQHMVDKNPHAVLDLVFSYQPSTPAQACMALTLCKPQSQINVQPLGMFEMTAPVLPIETSTFHSTNDLCKEGDFCEGLQEHQMAPVARVPYLEETTTKLTVSRFMADLHCDLCKAVMHTVQGWLQGNGNMQDTKNALGHLCYIMPSFLGSPCNNTMNDYATELQQYLPRASSEKVCHILQKCPAQRVARSLRPTRPNLALIKLLKERKENEKKCVAGPTFWCKNRENAKLCDATAYCNSQKRKKNYQ